MTRCLPAGQRCAAEAAASPLHSLYAAALTLPVRCRLADERLAFVAILSPDAGFGQRLAEEALPAKAAYRAVRRTVLAGSEQAPLWQLLRPMLASWVLSPGKLWQPGGAVQGVC